MGFGSLHESQQKNQYSVWTLQVRSGSAQCLYDLRQVALGVPVLTFFYFIHVHNSYAYILYIIKAGRVFIFRVFGEFEKRYA